MSVFQIKVQIIQEPIRDGQKSEFHLEFFQQVHFSMTQRQNFDAHVIRWKNAWRLMEKCGQSGILGDATFPSDTSIFPSAFPSARPRRRIFWWKKSVWWKTCWPDGAKMEFHQERSQDSSRFPYWPTAVRPDGKIDGNQALMENFADHP